MPRTFVDFGTVTGRLVVDDTMYTPIDYSALEARVVAYEQSLDASHRQQRRYSLYRRYLSPLPKPTVVQKSHSDKTKRERISDMLLNKSCYEVTYDF